MFSVHRSFNKTENDDFKITRKENQIFSWNVWIVKLLNGEGQTRKFNRLDCALSHFGTETISILFSIKKQRILRENNGQLSYRKPRIRVIFEKKCEQIKSDTGQYHDFGKVKRLEAKWIRHVRPFSIRRGVTCLYPSQAPSATLTPTQLAPACVIWFRKN